MESITVTLEDLAADYAVVERAIRFLQDGFTAQPSLAEVAEHVGLSEFHLQRVFSRWAGISPKRFLQHLTKEHAKRLLDRSGDLLGVSLESGLSGPGRLHDLFVACEAVSPGEFKRRGEGVTIRYGYHPTPLGECLLASSPRGIVHLAFVEGEGRDEALARVRRRWARAALVADGPGTRALAERVFAPRPGAEGTLSLWLSGTNFQIQVWEALLRIPSGSLVTYGDIAVAIGLPGSARAVGRAVGDNPIPVLVPCHRVIRGDGALGGYRYGLTRKMALLGQELARTGGD
ncbi:MAG: methylated-DNA--[protein]-cysteine S-methyltransferase [Chloroflexi bacterium]|nr:methylated-DNA--[protein]-cysteine S-methyltransferase [Chloroflexota bacterium]